MDAEIEAQYHRPGGWRAGYARRPPADHDGSAAGGAPKRFHARDDIDDGARVQPAEFLLSRRREGRPSQHFASQGTAGADGSVYYREPLVCFPVRVPVGEDEVD